MELTRRDLLAAPLAGLWAVPTAVRTAPAEERRFVLGVASGAPRPDRLVLWTRLMGDALPGRIEVKWELAHDEAFTRIAARGTEIAEAAWAHSVHAEPAGLAPARWYWYRFTALGERSPAGRTRTAPAPEASATLAFAIASCQRYEHGHYAAWRHLASEGLDLVMFLGDYIYEYPAIGNGSRPHLAPLARSLAQYRDRYALYKRDASLQAAHAACPWLVIWDDHEVENDCSARRSALATGADFLALRAIAYQAWWEHQPVPQAMRPVGPNLRLHDRFDWGRLARIHLLDERQYRDDQVCPRWPRVRGAGAVTPGECPALLDPARTILGAAQEAWLADGWDTDRRWNLVAQQTLMSRASSAPVSGAGTGEYRTDGWDGYAPARRRLLEGSAARQASNLVVLGGDLHTAFVADLKADYDDPKSQVVGSEFCTTSISSHGPAQSKVDRLLGLNPHLRHGRSDRRGAIAFALDERQLRANLLGVEDARDPASAVRVQSRFTVEAGRPGAQTG